MYALVYIYGVFLFLFECRFGFEELIEVAGYHTVVEFSYLVGALAIEAFEGGVRGDDIDLPGRERAEVSADIRIESLGFLDCAKAFAIGRIGDDRTASAGCADTARIEVHRTDIAVNTCAFCVLYCEGYGIVIDIRSVDIKLRPLHPAKVGYR